MTNQELFDYSGRNPEPIIDPYYNKGSVVITPTAKEKNALMLGNERLIELITVFNYLVNSGKPKDDAEVQAVIAKTMKVLDDVDGINFSAFSQFFMVYNSAHSSYLNYTEMEKREFVYQMLCLFCKERHPLYMSHGYTNSILQVVSDNYSHKRNSKTSIVKILDKMKPYSFKRLLNEDFERSKDFYLLPDKGDSALFKKFKKAYSVEMVSAKSEQDKLPDMLFKFKEQFYIMEMKTMKGSGGGQDKQLVEVINFIRYAEKDKRIHYITFMDGEYVNMLFRSQQPKIRRQYADIVNCLKSNPGNYFVNTAGFVKLMKILNDASW